jgi:hypothetical protein
MQPYYLALYYETDGNVTTKRFLGLTNARKSKPDAIEETQIYQKPDSLKLRRGPDWGAKYREAVEDLDKKR